MRQRWWHLHDIRILLKILTHTLLFVTVRITTKPMTCVPASSLKTPLPRTLPGLNLTNILSHLAEGSRIDVIKSGQDPHGLWGLPCPHNPTTLLMCGTRRRMKQRLLGNPWVSFHMISHDFMLACYSSTQGIISASDKLATTQGSEWYTPQWSVHWGVKFIMQMKW